MEKGLEAFEQEFDLPSESTECQGRAGRQKLLRDGGQHPDDMAEATALSNSAGGNPGNRLGSSPQSCGFWWGEEVLELESQSPSPQLSALSILAPLSAFAVRWRPTVRSVTGFIRTSTLRSGCLRCMNTSSGGVDAIPQDHFTSFQRISRQLFSPFVSRQLHGSEAAGGGIHQHMWAPLHRNRPRTIANCRVQHPEWPSYKVPRNLWFEDLRPAHGLTTPRPRGVDRTTQDR